MVFPIPPWVEIAPSQGNVRLVRLGGGNYAYQDPDQVFARDVEGRLEVVSNRFISRLEAVDRLFFDEDRGLVLDSFGQRVPLAAFRLPSSGHVAKFTMWQATWTRMTGDPRRFDTGNNQEVVERIVLRLADGTIETRYISYGLGRRYDKALGAGRWTAGVRDAIGEEEWARMDRRERYKVAKEVIVYREVLVKTLTPMEE